jgi:hypothetical protein
VVQANRFNTPVVVAEKAEEASIQAIDKPPVHSELIVSRNQAAVFARGDSLEIITAVERR